MAMTSVLRVGWDVVRVGERIMPGQSILDQHMAAEAHRVLRLMWVVIGQGDVASPVPWRLSCNRESTRLVAARTVAWPGSRPPLKVWRGRGYAGLEA
jgi:hypothetical protein